MTTILFCMLVAMFVLAVLFQERLIYFPRPYSAEELASLPASQIRRIRYRTSQGDQEQFICTPGGTEGGELVAASSAPLSELWIFLSGNASLALDWREIIGPPPPRTGFVLFDYPSYGRCAGHCTPETIDESLQGAVLAVMEKLKLPLDIRIHLVGYSLGAAVALRYAAAHPVTSVVLLAPFTTLQELAARRVGAPLSRLLRHRYDNLTALTELCRNRPQAPVVIFVGTEDRTVPAAMGEELAAKGGTQIHLRRLQGASHETIVAKAAEDLRAVIARAAQ